MTPAARRAIELGVLFGLLPAGLTLALERPPIIPSLLLSALLCYVLLHRDASFDRSRLWRFEAVPGALPGILGRLAAGGALLALATALLAPEILFAFPRRDPRLWALVMIGYPLASVGPQEIIFRAFFLHRYRRLLGPATFFASALAFAWVHIVFRNWLAVVLTLPAGVLFATTYRRHRSLACAIVEHALWGDLIFTLGLGRFFYNGL